MAITANTPGYTLFRGRIACVCLAEWIPVYEQELIDLGEIKFNVDIAQLTGNYVQSAGVHREGGTYDFWQHSVTSVRIAREMGGPCEARTAAQGFAPHEHGVLKGCPHNAPARYQIAAWEAGYNGLGAGGRGGRDSGPRNMPIPFRNWKEGIRWAKARQAKRRKNAATTTAGKALKPTIEYRLTKARKTHVGPALRYATKGGTLRVGTKFTGTRRDGNWIMNPEGRWLPIGGLAPVKAAPAKQRMRVGTLNLPAPGVGIGSDLGNDAARIKAAVRVLTGQSLDYVGLQELGGPKSSQVPSDFAKTLGASMGAGWFLHVPKLAFNENHALVRKSSFDKISRPNDVIIRGTHGGKTLPGKHVTPTTLTGGKAGERGVTAATTHLVPNNPAGAATQAVLAGRAAIAAAGRRRVVLTGDFNTGIELKALAKLGLVDAMGIAVNAVNPTRDTFVTYRATKATAGKGNRFDRVFVRPDDFTVREYKVVTDTSNGVFRQPRPGDHLLVVVDLEEK